MDEIALLRDRVRLLEKRLGQRERELSLLREMSLFFSNSVQSTIDLFAYRIGILTNAKFVRVYFIDRTGEKLRLVSGYNLSDRYLEMVKDRLEISTEAVPCGRAVREKAPYVVNDVTRDEMFSVWRDIAAMHGYLSYVALPLLVSGRVLGAVDIFFEHVRYFPDDELNLMSVLANAGALATENAFLLERIGNVSIVDEETGAYNHRHFNETLQKEAERADRYGQSLTLIMMDIIETVPGARTIEDRIGTLQRFVTDVKNKIRGSDMFFRYQQETFGLILTQTPRNTSGIIIPRLRYSLDQTFGEGWELRTGVSGVPEDGKDSETLVKKAAFS